MTTLAHWIDESVGWEERVGVSQLLDRVRPERLRQVAACVGRPPAWRETRSANVPIASISIPPGPTFLGAPAGAGFLRNHPVDLIHAWGFQAARLARFAAPAAIPLVVSCFNPLVSAIDLKALRALAETGPLAAVCASDHARRRLVEGGVPLEASIVIRPGVDFNVITRARKSPLRERLGLKPTDRVTLVPGPITDDTEEAVWALMAPGFLDPNFKVIVAGQGPPRERLRRRVKDSYAPHAVIFPDEDTPFEELTGIAHALVVFGEDEISPAAVAWGMAAGAVIIGQAGYALTELIAHDHNGLLINRKTEEGVVVALAKRLADPSAHARLAEVARGQAYDVFGLKRCVDQHLRLYDNLLAGRPLDDGILDSALTH